MRICKICGETDIHIEYHGKLRVRMNPREYTDEEVDIFRCSSCNVIWHEYKVSDDYYTSTAYRNLIEGNNIESHYKSFDRQTLEKLQWTGTSIYRNQVVADIGAAGGCFLDFILGVANKTIAVEPNEIFSKALLQKGHEVYHSAENVPTGYTDIVTSFDVIEHVLDPVDFVKSMHRISKNGGSVICGTPTDYPLTRRFAGEAFLPTIFQISHPWIFSEASLWILFEEAGFEDISVEQHFHFGIGNFINWLSNGTASGDVKYGEFSDTLNQVFRNELCAKGLGEYLVLKARKPW